MPMQTVRDYREGRWPDLHELRDLIRKMLKSGRRRLGEAGELDELLLIVSNCTTNNRTNKI